MVPSVESRRFQDLSVVIVSHDSTEVLDGAIRSARQFLPGAQIIVVENGSRYRDTTALVARMVDGVTVLAAPNLGFGAACNVGAFAASGGAVFFLNPDARIVKVAAGRLTAALAQCPVGLIAPVEVLRSGDFAALTRRDRRWRAEVAVYLARCFCKPSWLKRLPFENAVTNGALWASGAALLVGRSEFADLGGFDERLFLYHEDRDLSRRYRAAGSTISSTSSVQVTHAWSSGSDVMSAYRIACGLLSSIELAEIWDGAGHEAARLIVKVLGEIQELGKSRGFGQTPIVKRKSSEAGAVLDALGSVLVERPDTQYPGARKALQGLI